MSAARRPRHLADRELGRDAGELARAAFTHHWARCFLAEGGRAPLEREYRAVPEEAVDAVGLLYQAGIGPVRELAERYYADAGLHRLALSLVAKDALDVAVIHMSVHCGVHGPELADPLRDFLFLANRTAPRLRADVLRLTDPEWYRMARLGELTELEIDSRAIQAMAGHLGPALADRCGLEVQDFGYFTGPCVAHEASRVCCDNMTVARCVRAAGRYYVGGNASTPARTPSAGSDVAGDADAAGGTDAPGDGDAPDIRVFVEVNDVFADALAFYPAEGRPDGLIEKELLRLATDVGGTRHDLADAFRRWYDAVVVSHEEGHCLTGARADEVIRRRIERFGGDEIRAESWRFAKTVRELHADARVVERLARGGDEALVRFRVALPLGSAPSAAGEDAQTPETPGADEKLAASRALLAADPVDYVSRFLEGIDRAVVEREAGDCAAWIDEQLTRAVREVASILARPRGG